MYKQDLGHTAAKRLHTYPSSLGQGLLDVVEQEGTDLGGKDGVTSEVGVDAITKIRRGEASVAVSNDDGRVGRVKTLSPRRNSGVEAVNGGRGTNT